MPSGADRDMSIRLILFFVTTFAVIGVHLPFFPVFLSSRGFDAETIGIVLAVPLLVRVFSAPAIAFAADRTGAHRGTLIILCAGATAAFALFGLATGLWSVLAVAILFASVWTSVIPMTESSRDPGRPQPRHRLRQDQKFRLFRLHPGELRGRLAHRALRLIRRLLDDPGGDRHDLTRRAAVAATA